jgi:hypothetical protein
VLLRYLLKSSRKLIVKEFKSPLIHSQVAPLYLVNIPPPLLTYNNFSESPEFFYNCAVLDALSSLTSAPSISSLTPTFSIPIIHNIVHLSLDKRHFVLYIILIACTNVHFFISGFKFHVSGFSTCPPFGHFQKRKLP